MIRPASEIQYPPSEALCFKARMVAGMENLSQSSDELKNAFEKQLNIENNAYLREIKAFAEQQEVLLCNMRRIIDNN